MQVISIKVSKNKNYLIKVTKCNHYYLNQVVNGKVFYRQWTRTTKGYAFSLLEDFHGNKLPHIKLNMFKG